MCPFRVLVILFSLIIALCATMAALAEDPREEDERLASSSSEQTVAERFAAKSPSAKAWWYFVDFWSGRYLYRESKRLMPWFFSKDEPECDEQDEQQEQDSSSSSSLGDAESSDAAASAPEEELPEPSAPQADSDDAVLPGSSAASKHSSSVADAAFDHALTRRQQHLGHEIGLVGAVIS